MGAALTDDCIDCMVYSRRHSIVCNFVEDNIFGKDSLSGKYSRTGILGDIAYRALTRLILNNNKNGKPFSLSINFSAPHPPMIATPSFLKYYWDRKSRLLTPKSLKDRLTNTEYYDEKGRWKKKRKTGYDPQDEVAIRGVTAVYYGMVSEIDYWVGRLMDRLESSGISNNTLCVFTADHGELLGSHGRLGKGVLLEEAARVPLIVSYPGYIPPATVKTPVSHIDILATIFDYLGISALDRSDGVSMRRHIEETSYNRFYDETAAVSEVDMRLPINSQKFTDDVPSLMIRHGGYKLILPQTANARFVDMMFDLEADPFEQRNLLGRNGPKASGVVVSKAEHLKILLLEWMRRVNGSQRYYDIREILKRRTWRQVDYWQSDSELKFGKPALTQDGYRRNEFLYIGRTSPQGKLIIRDISILGADAQYFQADKKRAVLSSNEYIRIKISFHSTTPVDLTALAAYVQVQNSENEVRRIKIIGQTDMATISPSILSNVSFSSESPTMDPTRTPTGTPTNWPTTSPTSTPTTQPTTSPTSSPTTSPSRSPTRVISVSSPREKDKQDATPTARSKPASNAASSTKTDRREIPGSDNKTRKKNVDSNQGRKRDDSSNRDNKKRDIFRNRGKDKDVRETDKNPSIFKQYGKLNGDASAKRIPEQSTIRVPTILRLIFGNQ